MNLSIRSRLALGVAALSLVGLAPAVASAEPITVNLRVEGSAGTLYEGPVATEGATFETASSGGSHPCNYSENGSSESMFANGGASSGTPTTALRSAALAQGLAFDAEWFGNEKNGGNPGDFFVTKVGGDANLNESPYDSWGYAVNYTTAPVGGCQVALVPGSEVLWAYNYFNLTHLLLLSGPATANAGSAFAVHVADAQSGAPLANAAIGEDVAGTTTPISGVTTDAAGNATVTLSHTGTVLLKATRSDAVRSNALRVCVHNGNDGTCGTAAPGALPSGPGGKPQESGSPAADSAVVVGIVNGHVYPRHKGPRILRGSLNVAPGATVRDVRIRLERSSGRHCFAFNGSRAAFKRTRCGTARFFSVGTSASFSYLLPSALPAGRYVFDVEVVDAQGAASKLVNGVSHVVFRVR